MGTYVFDIETNGLNPDRVWCAVFLDVETQEFRKFYSPEGFTRGPLSHLLVKFVNEAECLIGHNILGFDIPVLQDVVGVDALNGRLVDTLIWSTISRKWRNDHTLEGYGEEYGRPKPKHEDWSKYSDEMLHRCSEDVLINYELWKSLCKDTIKWQGYSLKERA
jgi:hypothetical protein